MSSEARTSPPSADARGETAGIARTPHRGPRSDQPRAPGSLSLDQAPPIQVPFRFFHTAPLFLFVAAVLIGSAGPGALASRHSPAVLAATHLVTLGFMAMVMCGSLLQVMPVIVGAPVPRAATLGRWVHGLLSAGTILLASGFHASEPAALVTGACLASTALLAFLSGVAVGLSRARPRSAAILAIASAVAGLFVTVGLGLALALARAGVLPSPSLVWADLHPGWALLAWTTVLIMTVAAQVVPMFMLTPQYPRGLVTAAAPLLIALLVARSGASFQSLHWRRLVIPVLDGSLVLLLAGFALTTFWLLASRRRKVSDPTLLFWRAAMASLLVAGVLWCAQPFVSDAAAERLRLTATAAIVLGFAVTQILGMLYRIVPFLAWFHLHAALAGRAPVPTMKAFISDGAVRAHAFAWLATLGLGALALSFVPALTRPAAVAAAVAAAGLSWNLARASAVFRTCLAQAVPRPTAATAPQAR